MEEDIEQIRVNNFAEVKNTHGKTYTYI